MKKIGKRSPRDGGDDTRLSATSNPEGWEKTMHFSGPRPQADARSYVYGVIWSMLDNERPGDGGWIYGGNENKFDVRRLKKAVAAVQKEMIRKRDRNLEMKT